MGGTNSGYFTVSNVFYLKLREPYYDDCTDVEETILHVLRDCKHAKPIWMQLVLIFDSNFFFEYNLSVWLAINLQMNHGEKEAN